MMTSKRNGTNDSNRLHDIFDQIDKKMNFFKRKSQDIMSEWLRR